MSLLNKTSITGNDQFSKANADEVIDAINDNNSSIIQLPTFIYASTGDTIQLFYRSMIIQEEWWNFHVRITCTVGKQFPKYFECNVSTAGTYSLKVDLINNAHEVIESKTTSLVIKAPVQNPPIMQYVWCIGASTTASGVWQSEFNRRVTGVGGTPAGLGFSNLTLHTEGNPGYTWLNYMWTASTSPFIFSGIDGDMDFEQYRANEGLEIPTRMNIFMTWNGMTYWRTDAQWDVWAQDVRTFIDQARLAYPNVEIVLMSQLYPSLIGGLGANYGASGEYLSDALFCMRQQKRMAEIYNGISLEPSYSSFTEHIDCSLQHDAINNVSNFQKAVNTRNIKTETFGNNGLHPDTNGYYQVSDAVYREFVVNKCQ